MKPWEPGAFIVIEPGPVYLALTQCREEIEFLHTVNNNLRAALQTQAEEAAKHNAWLSQVHVLCQDLGVAPGHIEDRLFEAIGNAAKLIEQRDVAWKELREIREAIHFAQEWMLGMQ